MCLLGVAIKDTDCFLSVQMIDEFTDVNAGEKELMKLWNKYTLETKYVHGLLLAGASS